MKTESYTSNDDPLHTDSYVLTFDECGNCTSLTIAGNPLHPGSWTRTYDRKDNCVSHTQYGITYHAIAHNGWYALLLSDCGKVAAGCERFDSIADALARWEAMDDEMAQTFCAALKSVK